MTEHEAKQILERNGLKVSDKKIIKDKTVGLSILRAIDCLVKYHGYFPVNKMEAEQ